MGRDLPQKRSFLNGLNRLAQGVPGMFHSSAKTDLACCCCPPLWWGWCSRRGRRGKRRCRLPGLAALSGYLFGFGLEVLLIAYVACKFQGGHGPYTYLYESVWQDGKSWTRYVSYLGRFGADGPGAVQPGTVVVGPDGRDLVVPAFSPAVLRQLAASGGAPAHLGNRPEASDGGDLGSRFLSAGATAPEGELGSRQQSPSDSELGSRYEEGPMQLGSRPDPASGLLPQSGPEDGALELGSRSYALSPAAARPHRLPDGSWGVVSREEVAPGDQVQVRNSACQSWMATVVEAVEQGPRGTVAGTSCGPGS